MARNVKPSNAKTLLAVEGTSLSGLRSGVGRYTFELLSALKTNEIGVEIYTLAPEINDIIQLTSRVHYFGRRLQQLIWTLSDFLKLFRVEWLLRDKPNFILYPNFKYLRSKTPSLTIIHDISYTKGENWSNKGFQGRVTRWGKISTSSHTKIATVSKSMASEISNYYNYPLEEILILSPGIASNMIESGREIKDTTRKGFLVVGTFEKRKNVSIIVKAYNQLTAEQQRNNPLVIVGRVGNDFENINKLTQGNSNITLITNISDQDLIKKYSESAFLISASNYEGYGMQVAESMFFGLGLLLSDIPAHREVSAGFARFFPADNETLLLGILSDVTSYPQEYITKAKALANNYTWNSTADKLMDYILNNS